MSKFNIGEHVKCIFGKYNARSVEVLDVDVLHSPVLYQCRVLFNNKVVALYENELQSVFDFDVEMFRSLV